MALPAPPDGALTTPRFALRHSMIPRPASCTLKKEPDDLSPKSVIVDRRFVSPASSSSSSMDRHNTLSEPNHLKSCGQPRHDRGYSISDGEFSDPDSCMDSSGTSLELGKVGNSGPLESLPETHSLALEATKSNVALAVETANGLNGLESSETTAISIFVERSSDARRGELHGSSSAALRSDVHYPANQETSELPIPRSNSDITLSSTRGLQIPALPCAGDDENGSNQPSEWSQASISSGSASEQDAKEEEPSTRSYTLEPGSRCRRRDHHSSRPTTFSAELLSTSDNQVERGDDTKRARPVVVGQGAANNFGYPGTPLVRFSPSWSQAGTPPSNNTTLAFASASPRVERGFGSYSPASSADAPVGLRYQHRFLSGPIMGSMIPKPPPSKWDDAEKWIVSPGHSDQSPAQPHHRALPTLLPGRRNSTAGAQSFRYSFGADSPDYSTPPGEKPMSPQFENAFINAGKLETPLHATAALKKRSKALSFGDLSRRFDPLRAAAASKLPPAAAQQQHQDAVPFREDDDQKAQTVSVTMNTQTRGAGSAVAYRGEKQGQAQSPDESRIPTHARSLSMKEISTVVVAPVCFPEPTSCRDMGTQMTPAESLRNSTCTTPGLTTSPTRHNTPARSGRRACSLGAFPGAVESLELQSCHLAKLELRKLAGDGQPTLDRNSVWTTREEEEMESAASLRGFSGDRKNAAKASAWEEAEQTKALVRYKNKEAKIKAWEELQQAQAEAEMKKIEAKAEKIVADANEKMRGRMAMAAKKAADMRAAAEAVRNEQAAKATEKADLIRRTGLLSPQRSSFTSCFLV